MQTLDYEHCELCPRRCGVDRKTGARGVCGETASLRIASIGAHFGEEPSFTGQRGSGTVFLSGCACQCIFCQNHQISQAHIGSIYTVDAALDAIRAMIAKGVHNINFVTPDHFWPHLRVICSRLKAEGIDIPLMFNTSGYQRPELVADYAELVDIFLPDFKFAVPELAQRFIRAADYPDCAIASLREMVAAKGFLYPWDPSGTEPAREGVLVRHLVMPGQIENSRAVLRLLEREFGRKIPISIMSQYTPMPAVAGMADINRPLLAEEYATVLDTVAELGFEHVYLQELEQSADFVPDFRRESPFSGNRK